MALTRRPDCAYCGRPTVDLCAGCGLPFGALHGAAACPRCAQRSGQRARWLPSLLPTGRGLVWLLLYILIAAAAVAIANLP